jgi:ankyrin repeat protein
LLDHGADIDARDIDHESTPAQWMIGDRPEVAKYLVERGCQTDLLLAAAVGNVDLVRRHLDADPASISIRACAEFFPMKHPRAGGNIYFWTLGNHASAFQAATKYDHTDVLRLLMDRSPADVRLIAACWLHDKESVKVLLSDQPGLAAALPESDRKELAHAARNNDTEAVRLMLDAGFPVDARGQHRATPLHWASWHGNLEMVEALLRHNPALEDSANDFNGTPLGWATHGSENGWYCKTGRYPAVVEALLRAGCKPPEKATGTAAVRKVLVRYGAREDST